MVPLFPSSAFKKEKGEELDKVKSDNVCLLGHGYTSTSLQRLSWSALICFRGPRYNPAQPVLHGGMAVWPWNNSRELLDALREDTTWGTQRMDLEERA